VLHPDKSLTVTPSDPLPHFVQRALALWDLPEGATARLINLSENATYLIEGPHGFRAVLRVHRAGYHSRAAIESELAWLAALNREEVLAVPQWIPGRDGAAVQHLDDPKIGGRYMVLFDFLPGEMPDENGECTGRFETLGELAARCHLHVQQWEKPVGFERLSWDDEAVFGPDANWGDWRAAPNVTAEIRGTLESVEETLRDRLQRYGQTPDRFGLIHADMRLANLLVQNDETRVIDFDDCGFGWFLYDFAAAISFIEDDPRVPEWKAAWLRGYTRVRELSERDIAEIDTMIMLRRMALLAWIGSHMEAPEPQALAPTFARVTAELGAAYLQKMTAVA
jgi:Ser/Thr protein kinase RdoA (MazF antagonist)